MSEKSREHCARERERERQRTFNYFKEYVPSKFSLGGVKLLKCFMSCPAWTATNRLTQIKCCWNFTLCCQQYCCYCYLLLLLLFCSVLFCLNLLSVDIDWNCRRRRRRKRSTKKRSWFYLHSGFFILSYRVARIIVFGVDQLVGCAYPVNEWEWNARGSSTMLHMSTVRMRNAAV